MKDDFPVYAKSEVPVPKPTSFFGYTKADGSRVHDAPLHWPFGSIGPMTEYAARYVPEELLYEKEVPVPKIKPAEAAKAFDYLTRCLTMTAPMPTKK